MVKHNTAMFVIYRVSVLWQAVLKALDKLIITPSLGDGLVLIQHTEKLILSSYSASKCLSWCWTLQHCTAPPCSAFEQTNSLLLYATNGLKRAPPLVSHGGSRHHERDTEGASSAHIPRSFPSSVLLWKLWSVQQSWKDFTVNTQISTT